MILDLVPSTSDVLHTKCQNFDFDNPPMDPKELVADLKETMVKRMGVGLSANQVGLPYRVFVIGDPTDPDHIEAVFNPKVVMEEGEELIEEGCLSYPGMFIKIKRPALIRVRYANADGKIDTRMYDGIPARIFLHEYDHMDGVVFTERATKLQLDRAKKQKVKLDRLRKRNSNG